MADTHETIADIIHEARDKYTVHNCNECNYRKSCDWNDWNFASVECEAKRQSISLLLGIDDDYFNKLLDRLDAAHKREIEATAAKCCQLGRLAGYGASEIKHQQDAVGDAAKLREALKRIVDERGILDFCHNNISSKTWEDWDKIYKTLRKWIDEAMSALAAPPRNCDRFETVKEAAEAFARERQDMPHPCPDFTFSRWLLTPVKKEGENQ